jgi:hypothetical protein
MFRSFFTNLDRNTKRRGVVEQNLTDVGLVAFLLSDRYPGKPAAGTK